MSYMVRQAQVNTMNYLAPARNSGRNKDDQPALPRIGRHARPAGSTPFPDHSRDFSAADRALTEAQARLRGVGADPDAINGAFANAREWLSDAWKILQEARRELAIAHSEWEQANHQRQNTASCPDTAAMVVPDAPGLDLCPDPASAQTPAQYMELLRRYRVWAGQPSYRIMGQRCAQRFAASTIHAALNSDRLPSLAMVQAIVTGCGGTDTHQQVFTSAWRRLRMPRENSL
jgi:hypothetical protein